MGEPFNLTVAEAAESMRRRELTSRALTESLLSRIERLEPSLRAWVTIDREKVLGAAQERDRELEEKGPRGPLHGIPVGIKDIFYTEGMKTEAGSKIYADFVPDYDATAVARLKKAGAIVLGKTVTTELAAGGPSPTRNPWNPAHTAGGSSTGSAVAVAVSMCPAALGTQTGGSICRPASYNGVVGLSPSYGRISRYGVVPVSWSLDTIGILTRTVEDAALMLQVLAGYGPHDPTSSNEPVSDYGGELGSDSLGTTGPSHGRPPRIGLVREFFLERCDDDVRKNTEEAAYRLGQAGAAIEEIRLPNSFATSHTAHRIVMCVECAAFHEERFKERRQDYGPGIRRPIETGMVVPGVRYVQALRLRRRFRDEMVDTVGRLDALLTPTTPTAAPGDLGTTGDPLFQSPWTFAGMPSITLPSGLNRSGMPLAIQLAGVPFREARLLSVAHWCEAVLDVEMVPPGTD